MVSTAAFKERLPEKEAANKGLAEQVDDQRVRVRACVLVRGMRARAGLGVVLVPSPPFLPALPLASSPILSTPLQ